VKSLLAIATVMCIHALCAAEENGDSSRVVTNTIRANGTHHPGYILTYLAECYRTNHPGIAFLFEGTGSGYGLRSLARGECDVALIDRPLRKKDLVTLADGGVEPVTHIIAFESLAVVVNPSNSITNLSFEQLRSIWTGATTNWGQVGGDDQAILVGVRWDGAGLGADKVFHDLVSLGHRSSPSHSHAVNAHNICDFVHKYPNAVSWAALSLVTTNAKILCIDGVLPTRLAIARHQYRLSRPLYAVTDGFPIPGSPLAALLGFVRSPEGQRAVSSYDRGNQRFDSIVPLPEMRTSNKMPRPVP
jgi:phosphate transport system substrate-binding protein